MDALHKIDLSHLDLSLLEGHLKMGGVNPQGVEISANSRYLTFGGKPWLPVMGEFHYSRYPAGGWRDELLKMKACGVNIVATYLFWIHHEEIEGQVDWSGNCDLRRFVQLCAELGLYAYPRIGPWVHGEARNGGFPDWVLKHCGTRVRQDDPQYLAYVRRWYGEIAGQLKGLLWKDGGPVVGIQLENELTDNPQHLLTLKRMAQEASMEVPFYTMTGWGPAQAPDGDEIIPIFGGYADACWDRQTDTWARECRINFFFNLLRDDNAIGTDLLVARPGGRIVNLDRYPFGGCEIGGGMQVSYHRRAFISPDDTGALAMVKVGSGNNLQGYYMFHGGSHPHGKLSTMQESQATNYWNDYPVISYDFQAVLREFGQLNPSYHLLRPLHLFLNDFGARLAVMPAHLPADSPHELDDLTTLRWCVRSDGNAGFVFINNYQRIEALADHESVQLELKLEHETLRLPSRPIRIPSGAYVVWPFNLDMDGILLKYTTAQPICRLDEATAPCYVFSARGGLELEFAFDPQTLTAIEGAISDNGLTRPSLAEGVATFLVHGRDGKAVRVLVLDDEKSRLCWKATLHGRERLFLSPAALLFDGNTLRLRSCKPEELWFACYPALETRAGLSGSPDGLFTRYQFQAPEKSIKLEVSKIRPAAPARPTALGSQGVASLPDESAFDEAETWQVRLPANAFDGDQEIFLVVDYTGDMARAYLGQTLIADDFYNGRPWEIGLRRFLPEIATQALTLKFLPLHPEAPIYFPPEFRPGNARELATSLRVQPVYEQEVILEGNCSG